MKLYSEILKWDDIRGDVAKINAELFNIIDDISPDLPLYKAYYPYGEIIADKDFYLPLKDGKVKILSGDEFPYCMLMEKKVEAYLPKTVLGSLYNLGEFFPVNHEIPRSKYFNVRPNSVFSWYSGVRNISILPLQTSNQSYYNMFDKFPALSNYLPHNPVDHFNILKTICNQNNWLSSILVFGKEWKNNIFNNKKWYLLYQYILENSIKNNSAKRNSNYLDHAIYEIFDQYRVNIKGFSLEMIKLIFSIAVEDARGYKPAVNEEGLPLTAITNGFLENYSPLNSPIIMESYSPSLSAKRETAYIPLYGLDYELGGNKSTTTLVYMQEIHDTLKILLDKFKYHHLTKGTIYSLLEEVMTNRYYTYFGGRSFVKESLRLIDDDTRFKHLYLKYKHVSPNFCQRSLFTKSMISIDIDINKLKRLYC